MLLQLIAFGVIPMGDDEPGEPGTDTGAIIATEARTAVLAVLQATNATAVGVPLGATAWQQPLDPADHLPYAIDFTALLGGSEKIAAINEIAMPAAAAMLGVGIDNSEGHSPLIGTDGKKVQVWFAVEPGFWQETAFTSAGVRLPVTFRVTTDSTPPKRIERTAVLTVRQL
jgi:hypothetical protein